MHYVRSEHTLSDSHIPIQADYALNGQFVSNWEDISREYTIRSSPFLKQQVRFISSILFTSLYIIQYTANYVVQPLLLIFLSKWIWQYRSKVEQNSTISSSATSLYVGACICLILFGIALFATELSYINNFSPNHPIVQGRLISIFLVWALIHSFLFCIL